VLARTGGRTRLHHVWKQNTLSPNTTDRLLALLRPRYVFTGHDHEGCRYMHALPLGHGNADSAFAHEITVRAVQAAYAGHAELYEIHDAGGAEMRYAVSQCRFFTHIEVKAVAVVTAISGALLVLWGAVGLKDVVDARIAARRKRKLA
jgi:hypothetical protein